MNPPTPKLELIEQFLRENGWRISDSSERFIRYSPDSSLGLEEGFQLRLPADTRASGALELLSRATSSLSELHDLSPEQLRIVLSVPDTIVSLQVEDEATHGGSIPLKSFEGMLEKLRKALTDTASFVLTDDPLLEDSPDAASVYLNGCRFLQTEVGSFVAKVQLPSLVRLEDPTVFREAGVIASDVNRRFAEIVDFAFSRLLTEDPSRMMTSTGLEGHASVMTVDVLGDLSELLERTNAKSVNFRFLSSSTNQIVRSGEITDSRLVGFSEFVKYARGIYSAEKSIDLRGKIVELRSRNPRGNNNHIVVRGIVDDQRVVLVALKLNRADYSYASQAHTEGKTIRVIGKAREMKTQLRVTTLESFQILD